MFLLLPRYHQVIRIKYGRELIQLLLKIYVLFWCEISGLTLLSVQQRNCIQNIIDLLLF